MPRTSLAEYFGELERRARDAACVFPRGYRRVRWDYHELAATARQFARELEARQIAKGDRVLLWGENCGEWLAVFWGCMLRGTAVVPMDKIATADFVRRVAEQVGAKLAIVSRDLPAAQLGVPALVLEDLRETLAARDSSHYPAPQLARTDVAQIVFTSGTTAEPKGVVITHGNVLANLEPLEQEIRKYLKYERWFHPLRFLDLLPLSHVFGQFMGIFVPPLLGATVIFEASLSPSDVIRTIKRERISVVITVPRLLETLKDKLERDLEANGKLEWLRRQMARAKNEKFQRRWWRFRKLHSLFGWKFWAFISGGAALAPDTEEFWRVLSFVVIQGYGLTETSSLISVNHPFKLGRGSIGKVLPGRELKLDAQTGEILVRGENIASGYWQGKELRAVTGDEGWFHTGDLGALDAEGNLFFKGRMKNVIVTSAGMKIYPEDLEAALRRQPEVRDAVVVAVPRDGNAEACAVVLADAQPAAEAAIKRANESLAEYQQVRCWMLWPEDDFPRTSTQKPKIAAIEQVARAQIAGIPASATPAAGPLAELIARITGRDPGALKPGAKLDADLGLSSIDRVELMSALEDRYQLDLNETRFASANTVGQLEAMLREPALRRSEYAYPRWAQRWPQTWIRVFIYYLLTWPYTMLMAHPRVIGRERLSGLRGPALIVSNHVTYIDIGFLLAALPARFRHHLTVAMEGERIEAMRHPAAGTNWFFALILKISYWLMTGLFNVFPLPKTSGFRESFAFAGESVDRGYSVVVFPEGLRTATGELQAFQKGIGLLANRLALPVIPMRIDGLWEAKIAKKHFVAPNRIKVTIGEPVRYAPGTAPEQIAADLERRVREL